MGILDRLFGQERPSSPKDVQRTPEASPNDQALERYRYLVRTAPPEAIEQAHREAFEKLTPEQRQQVLRELSAAAPWEAAQTARVIWSRGGAMRC